MGPAKDKLDELDVRITLFEFTSLLLGTKISAMKGAKFLNIPKQLFSMWVEEKFS